MSLPTHYLEHGRHVARLHRRRRRARPRAIPLAMITMRKSIHGFFPLLSMGMGLRLAAFGGRSSAINHLQFNTHTKHDLQLKTTHFRP